MGNQNRKATPEEMERIRRLIAGVYPDCEPVFGGHGDYGGHRAPRDHTLSFRLRGKDGRFRSNVVWLKPDWLSHYSDEDLRKLVAMASGTEWRARGSRRGQRTKL